MALVPGQTHDVRPRPNTDSPTDNEPRAAVRDDIRANSIRFTIKINIKYWKPREYIPDVPWRPQDIPAVVLSDVPVSTSDETTTNMDVCEKSESDGGFTCCKF